MENKDNQWQGTKGGNTTADKVFLLSLEEVVKCFGDSGDLKNKRKVNAHGVECEYGYYTSDQYNSA